jgi:hypothetical protein
VPFVASLTVVAFSRAAVVADATPWRIGRAVGAFKWCQFLASAV